MAKNNIKLKVVSDGVNHAVVDANTGDIVGGVKSVHITLEPQKASAVIIEMVELDIEISTRAGFDMWFKIFKYEAVKNSMPINPDPMAYVAYFNQGLTPAQAVEQERG